MTPSEIRQALKARRKTQTDAATAIGLEYVKFNKVMRNVRRLTAEEDKALTDWLDKTPIYRAGEDVPATRAPVDDDYSDVPAYDIRVAAGAGSWVEETEPKHFLRFRADWLRTLAANPARLVVLQISGDSMWETLHDGDHVLVDQGQVNPRREGLYVIRVDDVLQVKRLAMHPVTRMLTIKSDNPSYPTYTDVSPDDVALLGRVVWVGRKL